MVERDVMCMVLFGLVGTPSFLGVQPFLCAILSLFSSYERLDAPSESQFRQSEQIDFASDRLVITHDRVDGLPDCLDASYYQLARTSGQILRQPE